MTRTVVIRPRFARALARLAPSVERERRRAVARTIAALATAVELPAVQDTEALMPPIARAFVRRVQGRNLWIWYTATSITLYVVHLSSDPPTPID